VADGDVGDTDRIHALGRRVSDLAERLRVFGMNRVADDLRSIGHELLELSRAAISARPREKTSSDER
jgi:hypothetical protein